ncbi:hypothetical protein [Ectopseudomonas oleovorans]|uniref:Uncharacterized protein n=1 Tax=Ectopseudomonas oleovorans (strain CECT 5344) TaxID=1182590 RepID=W6R114_ECTO5|nr:hypothetical protein [Pseudomonas oleovorans]CDM42402.1 hypothetical protein BN5_3860 [Pseudomonas oleovorans CECT 5344]CDR93025.1 hypothetical protein PPSAL_3801 [Pseudomonas oleovorans]
MNRENGLGLLSEDEVELIRSRRLENAKKAEAAALRLRILRAAVSYEAWFQEHERGSTYSTFTNEFGGDSSLWDSVEFLRDVVGSQ